MSDVMTFPETAEEFMEQYKVVDTEKVYTSGIELVPIFRMKQWFEHLPAEAKPVVRGKWQQVEVHENKRRWADQNVSAIASMYCPKCKRYHNEVYFHGDPVENVNFCPNCGADMRKLPEEKK